jgi:hypothetical protein
MRFATEGCFFKHLFSTSWMIRCAVDNPESGPSFGADSLVIPLSKDNPKLARSKLGSYFERMSDGGNSLFGKDASVQLKTLRVYHGVYGPDEYIPFTDAEPLALY